MKLTYSVNTGNQDKKPNETNIYRNPLSKDCSLESTLKLNTMQQLYKKVLQEPQNRCLGKRRLRPDGKRDEEFSWYTSKDVFSTAERFGSGLINLKLVNSINEWQNLELSNVGFYSINTVRMITADISCGIYNFTIIPLYDTLGDEAMDFVLQ